MTTTTTTTKLRTRLALPGPVLRALGYHEAISYPTGPGSGRAVRTWRRRDGRYHVRRGLRGAACEQAGLLDLVARLASGDDVAAYLERWSDERPSS